MNRLQQRIALVLSTFCVIVGVLNFVQLSFLGPPGFPQSLLHPSVSVLFPLAAVVYFLANRPHPASRLFQALLPLLMGGPALYANGPGSFFGYWLLIMGVILLYKYQFLQKNLLVKFLAILIWAAVWIYLTGQTSLGGGYINTVNNLLFVFMALACLYFFFEEEIRELLAANRSKDAALAEQAAEIARLEPLSVLGQRVAHVAHSFKNNISLVGTALFYIENNDNANAARKIREYSQSMNQRIDEILLVSQAGVDREAEVFDAARLLGGLNQVYLTEPAFLQRAKVELEAPEPTPVFAVRWDFLLMAENILKNALDALIAKGGHGTIRVSLKDRLLTLANDGGAMALCGDCQGECLSCPRYGKPGQTTREGGSGHGLAQVFATCRKYDWKLRIRVEDEWTFFEVNLKPI